MPVPKARKVQFRLILKPKIHVLLTTINILSILSASYRSFKCLKYETADRKHELQFWAALAMFGGVGTVTTSLGALKSVCLFLILASGHRSSVSNWLYEKLVEHVFREYDVLKEQLRKYLLQRATIFGFPILSWAIKGSSTQLTDQQIDSLHHMVEKILSRVSSECTKREVLRLLDLDESCECKEHRISIQRGGWAPNEWPITEGNASTVEYFRSRNHRALSLKHCSPPTVSSKNRRYSTSALNTTMVCDGNLGMRLYAGSNGSLESTIEDCHSFKSTRYVRASHSTLMESPDSNDAEETSLDELKTEEDDLAWSATLALESAMSVSPKSLSHHFQADLWKREDKAHDDP